MDQNDTHRGPSRLGGIGLTNNSAEFATVVEVDVARYSYTVRTQRGRALPGVPRKRSSPSDLVILPVGTTVVVRFDLGIPYIDGVLDLPSDAPVDPAVPVSEIGGIGGQGLNQATNTTRGNYRGPSEPTDVLPGDSIMANYTGARVGVLEGGVAVLSASQLAQVRAHVLNDLVEIISRNFRHVTDMGIFKVENKDGRINLSFRGASDQTNEAGADAENWTIRLDLGAEGDVFRFELTTPTGQSLFRMHVDSEGRCELFGLDGLVFQSGCKNGEPHISEHGGNAVDIVHGRRTVTTNEDHVENVKGNVSTASGGDMSIFSGNDLQQAAARDLGLSAGRNATLSVAGDKRGNPALVTNVQGGDYEVHLGQTSYPEPGITVTTFSGDMSFISSNGGNLSVNTPTGDVITRSKKVVINTSTPNSVILGGTTLAAHLVKFEQLELLLKILIKLLDTHTHTSAAPLSPTSTPTVPFSTALSRMIGQLKSERVGVGG